MGRAPGQGHPVVPPSLGPGSWPAAPAQGSPAGTGPPGFAGHPWAAEAFRGGTARHDGSLTALPGAQTGTWASRKGQNPRARSRDPSRTWRCRSLVPPALCPGKPQRAVPVPRQVWAQTLSFAQHQPRVPFRGAPCVTAGGVGESRTPNSGGFLLPGRVFPCPEASGQAGEASASRVSAPAAARHRGLSLSHGAAGDRHSEPPLDPRVPPAPCWHRSGSGGSGSDTAVAARSLSERGWAPAWGLSRARFWGAGGRGRAGVGPCPAAPRHRCSPNTPDLKRRFQPGAGGRGSVPPSPVTHSPGAWHPGRAPAAPPSPARTPRGCCPGRQPPNNGPGRSTIGSCLGAAAPAAWAAHSSCPRPPLPAPRLRGSQASPRRSPLPGVPRAGRGARAGAALPVPGGAAIQESHRKLLGAAPEIKGGRRIRGVSCGGEEGSGGPAEPPRCPHSLHRHRHEAAASLQPREPLRDPAAPLPGLPGGPG